MVVNDVYVEDNSGEVLLTLDYDNQTKNSAILKDTNKTGINSSTINTIRKMLEIWEHSKIKIAEKYVQDKRNTDAFLYDVVALAKYVSSLPVDSKILMDVSEGTTLLHNRIISQILYEYNSLDYEINPKPTNFLNNKRHDFNISKFRCETKTIQTLGKLERLPLGGFRFTDSCRSSLISNPHG